MAEWVAALGDGLAREGRAVLVTIAHAAGSTPRAAGTAMVVSAHGLAGTIGGGHLEFEVARIARDALGNVALAAPWVVRFPLAARLGQCCGGVVTIGFTVVDAASAASWLPAAQACLRDDIPFALVSRVGGHAAQHRVVTAERAIGSLGDAQLDATASGLAQERLALGIDSACLVEGSAKAPATLVVLVAAQRPFVVLVFGNGHVGRALVHMLAALPARIRWIDERVEDFPPQIGANVDIVATDAPEDELRHAPAGACVVVMTHSHALDYRLVEAALCRGVWSYVGLIGSVSKRNQFERRLRAHGVADAKLTRLVCPIGVRAFPALRGKEPGVIAVGVTAELLAIREQRARQAPPSSRIVLPAQDSTRV